MSTTVETVPELSGKTIAEAIISTNDAGDQELVIRCTDGTEFTVGAWQTEGYPVQMAVTPRGNKAKLKT